MRSKFLIQTILIVCIAVPGLTGCKGWPWKKKPATAETGVPPLGGAGDIGVGERPLIGEGQLRRGQFQPVYFDFDSARIRPGEMPKLEAVAAFMRANPAARLLVEGHCDERGTAEYNRALGERRAQAAREELVRLGVDAHRISTISYGKERPADPGHDETAWAQNRRCEFVVVGQ